MADIYRYDGRAKKIGERIRKERKALIKDGKTGKFTQKDLQERISEIVNHGPNGNDAVTQSTISDWESGRRLPPLDMLACLAEIFGCDIGYLLGDYDRKTADSATLSELTGLGGDACDVLVALNRSKSYFAPFRKKLISDILESRRFLDVIAYMDSAVKSFCGVDKQIAPDDLEEEELAASQLYLLNFASRTNYTVISGEENSRHQTRSATDAMSRLIEGIIDRECREIKNHGENNPV